MVWRMWKKTILGRSSSRSREAAIKSRRTRSDSWRCGCGCKTSRYFLRRRRRTWKLSFLRRSLRSDRLCLLKAWPPRLDHEGGGGFQRGIGPSDERHDLEIGLPLARRGFAADVAALGVVELHERIVGQNSRELRRSRGSVAAG